jgi:transcriptional regulator with XRE-family HTH domain
MRARPIHRQSKMPHRDDPKADDPKMGQIATTVGTIGGRIAAARVSRGWKKAELARRLGKSWRLLHKWETDEQPPDRESLRLLSGVLGMTIEELLGVAAGQDPPWSAWREFLEAPEAATMDAGERRALQSLAWPPGREPTVAGYLMTLAALRGGTRPRS